MFQPEKIVLIRGLSREARHWGPSLDSFKKSFPYSEILTPDLPGAGINNKGKVPLKVSDYIPILRNQVRLGENCVVVGLSLGGMCAIEWVKQYPNDFKAAVVINSSLGDISAPWERFRLTFLKEMAMLTTKPVDEFEYEVLKFVSNNPKVWDEAHDLAMKLHHERPMKLSSIVSQLISGALYRSRMSQFPIPLLVLASMKDHLVNVSCSMKIAEKFNAEIKYHPWAGHELPMDDPEWVSEAVCNWVNSLEIDKGRLLKLKKY